MYRSYTHNFYVNFGFLKMCSLSQREAINTELIHLFYTNTHDYRFTISFSSACL